MPPDAPPTVRPHRITEIEGLRGFALTLVVLFHLFGGGRVSGGVDVFLFVSGFLLTLSLARWALTDRPADLGRRYGRILVRLTPAAVLVIASVGVLTVATAPMSTWVQTGREMIASALYAENWELIGSQLAYGAAGPDTSPLQHFWSLSVQGQFFLVWPALIVAVALLSRRLRLTPLVPVAVLSVSLTLGSFAYAAWLNSIDPEVAYFDSFARFWELGAGAVLALCLAPLQRRWTRMRVGTGWLGLALILGSGFLIDGARLFPGPLALVPIAGAAMIIIASGAPTRSGVDRFLDLPVVTSVAKLSYPLYLWHWPILITYLVARDRDEVGPAGAAAVLTVSVMLAWATNRWVERPVLDLRGRVPSRRLVLPSLAAIAVVSLVAVGGTRVLAVEQARALAATLASPDHPGARALAPMDSPYFLAAPRDADPLPGLDVAANDRSVLYTIPGCLQGDGDTPEAAAVIVCVPEPIDAPTREVVLAGGSHIVQWYDALLPIARSEQWQLTVVVKTGCRLAVADKDVDSACRDWGEAAVDRLIELDPDAVLVESTRTPVKAPAENIKVAQTRAWQRLAESGLTVVGVRDTPRFDWSVPECLGEYPDSQGTCSRDRDRLYLARSPVLDAPETPPGMLHLDLVDDICSATRCDPIVGNVVAYYDDDHISATFARTLTPALDEQLRARVPALFDR